MGGSKGCSGGKEAVFNEKNLPTMKHPGKPNTQYDYYQNDLLKSSRITNANGIPIQSIHYTNHGNSKIHPVVPHNHDWGWQDGEWREFSKWY